MAKKRPLLVTSALPYANGPLHFGHIAGAYLPADIFVRYHRLKGSDVVYICGTDEHGVAITFAAEKAGKGYKEYVDYWYSEIVQIFQKFDIVFDNFSQTSREDPHYPLSQEFFLRLLRNGHIEPRTTEQHYCLNCKRYLPDRFVEGVCYMCGADGARGDECKVCGNWLEAAKLRAPVCSVCRQTPELRDTTQWELNLQGFDRDPALKPWFDHFRERMKPNVYHFVVSKMIESEGLRARPITRDLPWGVPVPERDLDGNRLEGVGEKVLYVWFDAPIGYISSTIEWAREVRGEADLWRRYWVKPREISAEEGPRIIHFIGKDNIPFHCVVFPAMLGWQGIPEGLEGDFVGPGPDEEYVLPENVPANEFYNLEGRKFNTSEGWYIDLEDFFSKYDTDQIRYYITMSMPENADSNFIWRDFLGKSNGELADIVGNLAMRVLKFIKRYYGGGVPDPGWSLGEEDEEILKTLRKAPTVIGDLMETYQFRRALRETVNLARLGNKYFDAQAPWETRKSDQARCDAAIFVCVQILKTIAPLLWPFVPASAERLWAMLGMGSSVRKVSWDTAGSKPIPAGHAIGDPQILFQKIDPEVIEAEIEKLRSALEARAPAPTPAPAPPPAAAPAPAPAAAPVPAPAPEVPPFKSEVSFDRFQELDIRIARITGAEPIKGTEKLLALEVDLGREKRRLVAGIAKHYSPEDLVGCSVAVLANLTPRKIRGVESRGMILAADIKGAPVLLLPDREVPPGSTVR
jgi:methionyl-tRNA synthetase